MLDAFRWRLMSAQIDNRDALDVIRYWDSDDTVFYIDPPYVSGTRVDKTVYTHEASEEHHKNLVSLLSDIKGKAVLSGYEHPIYEDLIAAGWKLEKINKSCNAAARTRGSKIMGTGSATQRVPRTECLWIKS